MRSTQILLFACSWLARGSVAGPVHPRSQSLTAILTNGTDGLDFSAHTLISFPGSTTFYNATERWDIYAPPSYGAAISPATEADVVTAVQLLRKFNLPFLATGARHGYSTTLEEVQGGIAIDLSQLDGFVIDKDAGTLTVGPGVRFIDIFGPVYEAGFQIQTGTCSCVGFLGAMLGGGIGRLLGLNGLMIDALVSARIVTADGQILEVSETSNSDLFWGVRGAGQNFGIITSATLKLTPLYKSGVWTSADLIFTPEKNVTFFNTLASMLPLPPQLTVETVINYNTTLDHTQLMLSLVYAGPQDEAVQAMAPILNLGPSYSNIKEINWSEISTETTFLLDGPICEDQQIYDIYAVNLRNLSASTWVSSFTKLAAFFDEQPLGRDSDIVLETWPIQAAVAISDDATAYPWRDATTYVMIQMRWNTTGSAVEGPSNELGVELRSDLAATSGYDGLTVYVNYAYGDETIEEIYAARKLPQLAKLKAQYDPDNVFGFYHALPTSYP